jgi:hypothetical protein
LLRCPSWVGQAVEPTCGPGPNGFDDSSETVDVDHEGGLVLRVRRTGDDWVCAEVVGEEATGYGTYEWTIRSDLCGLDRQLVLGMFTWSDEPDRFHQHPRPPGNVHGTPHRLLAVLVRLDPRSGELPRRER